MKRYLILLIWIAGILLPLSWVGKLMPTVRHQLGPFVRPLITPEWVRILAHTTLFAGLVLLLAFALKLKRTWLSGLFLLTVVMAIGLGQEGLQLVAKGRSFGWPEMFDLGVDLSGGMIGWLIWGMIRSISTARFFKSPEY